MKKKIILLIFIIAVILLLCCCNASTGSETVTSASPEHTLSVTEKPSSTPLITVNPSDIPSTPKPLDVSEIVKEEMPRIDINTLNGKPITGSNTEQPLFASTVSMSLCKDEYKFENVSASVRVRGNSTATAAKKPLKLKFDEKINLLGLNNGKTFKTWVLLADIFDETMMRNWTAFKLGKAILGNDYYCSDCAHVEVYINNEYFGVYTLCEQTQIKKNRVNIAKKDDDDTKTLHTGYLLIGQGGIPWGGNYFDIPIGFSVTDRNGKETGYGGIRFVLSGDDSYSQEQRDFISNYVSGVFFVVRKAIYENSYYNISKDGIKTTNSKLQNDKSLTDEEKQIMTVSKYIDIDSAVKMCVLDEIVKNLDAMTFNIAVDLSDEGDGRLTFLAPWDFDHAMGKTKYASTHSTSGWYATNLSVSDGTRVNFMFVLLAKADWFNRMMKDVWLESYSKILDVVYNEVVFESYRYEDAFTRDWERWGGSSRPQTGHQSQDDMNSYTCHSDSTDRLVKWLKGRVKWLNGEFTGVREEAVQSELTIIDCTKPENMKYFTGFGHTSGTITDKGLKVVLEEAFDPQFYLDLTFLEDSFEASDYPIFEMTYMIPNSNQDDSYGGQLFLCTGSREHAEGGISVDFVIEKSGSSYKKLTMDLSQSPYWEGTINKIRIDYFNSPKDGDIIYIKEIALKVK